LLAAYRKLLLITYIAASGPGMVFKRAATRLVDQFAGLASVQAHEAVRGIAG